MSSTLPSVFSAETRPLNESGDDRGEARGETEPQMAPGTELGRYVIIEPLGSGGMGVVQRAYDPKLQREVALKLLRSEVLDDTAAERMIREAQAMAQLAHPNVVAIYDVERSEETVLLAMELIEGCTLSKWLRTKMPSWSRILEAFVQAGRGLAAAHHAGLVHRDFKPANVLVGDDGRVRVTDFGLARPLDERVPRRYSTSSESHADLHAHVTQSGTVVGTPHYMAPEQHLGDEANAKADQYAFCVALWQALHGSLPFRGTFEELAKAKTLGPPPWPRESKLPRKIGDAILRGLSSEPRDRWPSMGPLLGILDRDPARTRLRWITANAVGVATLATVGGIAGWWTRDPEVCGGARDHLAGIWDESRRAQTAQALQATGLEYAERTQAEIERSLDLYAQSWVSMHTETCEATSVRREQSAAVLDLRMSCLQQRLHSLEATVEVLGHADASVVERAITLVADLRPVSTCADVDALQSAVPPPEDPELADAVEEARRELARARAIGNVGRQTEALEILDRVADQALPYGPLGAEIGLQRGQRLSDLRHYDEAAIAYEHGYEHALEVGHERTAILALAGLGFALGTYQTREDEGMRLLRIALAMAKEGGDLDVLALVLNDIGGVMELHAHHEQALEHFTTALEHQQKLFGDTHPQLTNTLSNLATSRYHLGDFDASFELRTRSLELERRIFGEEHPRVARMLHTLGNDLHNRGDYEAAAEHYGQALEMRRRLLGPRHPDTAHSLSGLGLALTSLGRHAEAEQQIRVAFEILERNVGLDQLEVMDTLNTLAIAIKAQGRYEEALALHLRVLEVMEDRLGSDHPRTAMELTNVGGLLIALRRYDEALPMLERAVEIQGAALGPEHPHFAIFEMNAAEAVLGLGRADEAEDRYRRTIPIMEKAFGAEHSYLSHGLIGLGRALHAQGKREEALIWLEHGLSIRQAEGATDPERAEAAFALARALGEDERARAQVLAERARSLFAGAGPGHARDVEDVDAWLADRSP